MLKAFFCYLLSFFVLKLIRLKLLFDLPEPSHELIALMLSWVSSLIFYVL